MADCAGKRSDEAIPSDLLVHGKPCVDLRDVVEINKRYRVVNVLGRIACYFFVLTDSCVDFPDVEERDEYQQVKHSSNKNRLVAIYLALSELLIAVCI